MFYENYRNKVGAMRFLITVFSASSPSSTSSRGPPPPDRGLFGTLSNNQCCVLELLLREYASLGEKKDRSVHVFDEKLTYDGP